MYCLLKPGLENFEHYFTSVCDEYNCAVVWALYTYLILKATLEAIGLYYSDNQFMV